MLTEGWLLKNKRHGWAFVTSGLTVALTVISVFAGLFPRVMVSSLDPKWSLTIYNASSTPYTLTVMTIVAAIFVPIVLIYQGWTYWVFRERIGRQNPLEY
jgi:cytochrome d ubiquinol oxidase subunit II